MNNLIPQSGTKAQRLAENNYFVFICAFYDFVPHSRDEMLLLIQGLFHSLFVIYATCRQLGWNALVPRERHCRVP
jgi:hypothetical protein